MTLGRGFPPIHQPRVYHGFLLLEILEPSGQVRTRSQVAPKRKVTRMTTEPLRFTMSILSIRGSGQREPITILLPWYRHRGSARFAGSFHAHLLPRCQLRPSCRPSHRTQGSNNAWGKERAQFVSAQRSSHSMSVAPAFVAPTCEYQISNPPTLCLPSQPPAGGHARKHKK